MAILVAQRYFVSFSKSWLSNTPGVQTGTQLLYEMHREAVEKEFDDPNTSDIIPFVLDAMIVAVLSQLATN